MPRCRPCSPMAMATSSTAWSANGATISIPWQTTTKGERVYGRGTADNKGQHSINLAALRAVREARGGKLGFNAKFIIETGEEIGSPDLRQVCEVPARRAEGRSVPGIRRAAAFGGPPDHLPRLPRRQPHPSRRQSARRRASFRQLGRRARQSRDDPGERDREPRRWQGADEARSAEAAADFEPGSRGARGREDRADRGRAGAVARLGRGGIVAG